MYSQFSLFARVGNTRKFIDLFKCVGVNSILAYNMTSVIFFLNSV